MHIWQIQHAIQPTNAVINVQLFDGVLIVCDLQELIQIYVVQTLFSCLRLSSAKFYVAKWEKKNVFENVNWVRSARCTQFDKLHFPIRLNDCLHDELMRFDAQYGRHFQNGI